MLEITKELRNKIDYLKVRFVKKMKDNGLTDKQIGCVALDDETILSEALDAYRN